MEVFITIQFESDWLIKLEECDNYKLLLSINIERPIEDYTLWLTKFKEIAESDASVGKYFYRNAVDLLQETLENGGRHVIKAEYNDFDCVKLFWRLHGLNDSIKERKLDETV